MDIPTHLHSSSPCQQANSQTQSTPGTTPGIRDQIKTDLDALKLTEMGATPMNVHLLTGLPKAAAKALYRDVHHVNPHGGQTPFTDRWYVKTDQRLLHANVVWYWNTTLATTNCTAAERLIDLYELYLLAVLEPLLSIRRVAFVPRLLQARIWRVHHCNTCSRTYVSPATDNAGTCPACRVQHLYRCIHCGHPLKSQSVGRRLEYCPVCGEPVRDAPLLAYE